MYKSYAIPISVKGVVWDNGKVWLRRNEREEWELPGGKLDEGEQPEETVVREMREELGFEVEPVKTVQAHVYTIKKSLDETKSVLVLSYVCRVIAKVGNFEHVGEAGPAQFKAFAAEEMSELNIPEFYKEAIRLSAE